MQAIDLLLHRASQPRLQSPAPVNEELEKILQAGLRAPDHKLLTPWRFIVCTGHGLEKLGNIFKQAAIANGADQCVIDRATQLPQRAPMIIIGICRYTEKEGVPRVEQISSAACALHDAQLAAKALGYDSMWRTGSYAQDQGVKQALDLGDNDEIIGFLYVGTSPVRAKSKPLKNIADYTEFWS